MTDAETLRIHHLPGPIAKVLDDAASRIRRILLLRGLVAVLAVALGGVLAVMALDASVLIVSGGVRWTLSLILFAVIAAAVYLHLYRPLRRRFTPVQIARVIETRNPDLREERISSTVEILGRQRARGEEFSESLLQQLVEGAERDAGTLRPGEIFTWRSAKRFFYALAGVGLIYLALFVAWPGMTARMIVRAIAPGAQVGGVHARDITLHPGNVRMARGEPLTLKAELREPVTGRVELRTRRGEGKELIERMLPSTESPTNLVYSVTFPRVEESFKYRVRAGRSLTPYRQVRVFDRPKLTWIHFRQQYPGHTGLPPRTESGDPGRLEAFAGGTMTLAIETNVALRKAELFIGDESMGVGRQETREERELMTWMVPVTGPARDTRWNVWMVSGDGLENKPVATHEFDIQTDEAPRVVLTRPARRKMYVAPDGFVGLEYAATDDFGIGRVTLRVRIEGRGEQVRELSVPEEAAGNWIGRAPLDLSALDLDGVNTVRADILVADNLPEALGGPNRATTETLVVNIQRQVDSPFSQNLLEMREPLVSAMEEAVRKLEDLRKKAEELKKDLEKQTEEDTKAAERKAEEIRDELAGMQEEMRRLPEQMENTPFQQRADEMQDFAEETLEAPKRTAGDIPQDDDAQVRQEQAETLQEQLKNAREEAGQMLEEINKTAEEAENLAGMMEMTSRQEQLAHQAEEGDIDERWQERQEELAEQLANMPAADFPAMPLPPEVGEQAAGEPMEGDSGEGEGEPQEGGPMAGEPEEGEGEPQEGGPMAGEPEEGEGEPQEGGPMEGEGEPMKGESDGGKQPESAAEAAQQAMEAAAEAAGRGEQQRTTEQSAEAARQLEGMTDEMSRRMGLPQGPPPPPRPGTGEGEASEQTLEVPTPKGPEDVPPWALEMGISGDDWSRLGGEVGKQGEAGGGAGVPAEYRDLVRRYFEELNREQ